MSQRKASGPARVGGVRLSKPWAPRDHLHQLAEGVHGYAVSVMKNTLLIPKIHLESPECFRRFLSVLPTTFTIVITDNVPDEARDYLGSAGFTYSARVVDGEEVALWYKLETHPTRSSDGNKDEEGHTPH